MCRVSLLGCVQVVGLQACGLPAECWCKLLDCVLKSHCACRGLSDYVCCVVCVDICLHHTGLGDIVIGHACMTVSIPSTG